jgi:aldehyde dehydrogenase (NAD+)
MAQNYVCGDPFDPATQQGPQANRLHCEKIWHYINKGQAEGAELLTETSRSAWPERGFFVPPTIFSNVNNQMTIAREEIFGPVLCLIPFDHEDEAISIANDSPYGLAAGVYTGDASKSQRVASQLNAGMIFINHYGCYDFASPFGGFKQSGWGKEMAIHSLAAYTKTKSIWMKY